MGIAPLPVATVTSRSDVHHAPTREALTVSTHLISSIAHRWGFSDSSHFSRTFKAHYGSSPRDYRHAAQAVARQGGAPIPRPGTAVQEFGANISEAEVTTAEG